MELPSRPSPIGCSELRVYLLVRFQQDSMNHDFTVSCVSSQYAMKLLRVQLLIQIRVYSAEQDTDEVTAPQMESMMVG